MLRNRSMAYCFLENPPVSDTVSDFMCQHKRRSWSGAARQILGCRPLCDKTTTSLARICGMLDAREATGFLEEPQTPLPG